MIKNYLLIAWRNLVRYKGFSFINIAGLTLGLAACMLIGFFVWDEKQFDRSIPSGEDIYRIYCERTVAEGTSDIANTPPMFATTLKADYPNVETAMRIMMLQSKPLFEVDNKSIYEEEGLYTETSFFEIFPLKVKYGSTIKSLDDNNSIVLSRKMSERYFGQNNPVGRTIMIDKEAFIIKAVLDDLPKHFHLKMNFVLPLTTAAPEERMKSWVWQQFYTYIKLKPGSDPEALESSFRDYIRKNIHPQTSGDGMTYMPILQPLHDIHLHSAGFKYDNAIRGNISYVKGLTIIAIFILLIACFNFINLATAQSLKRAREVGVRKSIGASRRQLVLQFTGETIFLTLISLILAIGVVLMVLPALNRFTGKEMDPIVFANPLFLLMLIGLAMVVGLIAGIYPAFVLSHFQPVKVLKSSTDGGSVPGKIHWLRHGLVVIQFTLAALLIVSAFIVYRQVNYLHNKDLGFNKEQIMFFPMRGDNMFNNYESFKNELTTSPGISSVSIGYGFPGDIFAGDEIVVPKDGERKTQSATHLMVDYDYLKTLDLRLLAGRDFSKAMGTDQNESFIINETAVRELGFQTPEKAIGQQLMWHPWDATRKDSMKVGKVIGVVKDFNYKSLYDRMEIAVLHIYPPAYWKVAVKMKTADVAGALAHVKTTWSKFSPEFPIEYKFMDDNFETMYVAEDKLRTLLSFFTGLTIFVGCLGLFGLAAYTASRRKKEIGIRKTLGASVQGIVMLLSKDFVRLVLISLVIASPIAWYFMSKWLEDFAYRTSIAWWIFPAAGALVVLIALLTTSFQALKAALTSPVKSLRTE